MKAVLVHDQLTQYGGAERVLEVLHEIFQSPIYTTVYLKDKLPEVYKQLDIHTSFINNINFIKNNRKLRTVLFPLAIESLNLQEFDLIISDTQGISKGVKKSSNQKHISYIHTIPWAVWNLKNENGRYLTKHFGQKWDYKTAQSPDLLIANSIHTQNRIRTFYQRDSQIIYPPVNISEMQDLTQQYNQKKDYVAFVGRLEGYKGELELAKACTELKQKLIIVGKGKNSVILKSFSKYVELRENVDDLEKYKILKQAKVTFNGSVEDFGINMVESIALGTPVIALNIGGSLEIITDKTNGLFIDNLEIGTIKAALSNSDTYQWHQDNMQKSVIKFSKENFKSNFKIAVDSLYSSKS